MNMDFRELNKFIKTMGKEYNIPAYSISVYYNHRNVYYGKKGNATFLDKIKGIFNKDNFGKAGMFFVAIDVPTIDRGWVKNKILSVSLSCFFSICIFNYCFYLFFHFNLLTINIVLFHPN